MWSCSIRESMAMPTGMPKRGLAASLRWRHIQMRDSAGRVWRSRECFKCLMKVFSCPCSMRNLAISPTARAPLASNSSRVFSVHESPKISGSTAYTHFWRTAGMELRISAKRSTSSMPFSTRERREQEVSAASVFLTAAIRSSRRMASSSTCWRARLPPLQTSAFTGLDQGIYRLRFGDHVFHLDAIQHAHFRFQVGRPCRSLPGRPVRGKACWCAG